MPSSVISGRLVDVSMPRAGGPNLVPMGRFTAVTLNLLDPEAPALPSTIVVVVVVDVVVVSVLGLLLANSC